MRIVTCHDGEQCDANSHRWLQECRARALLRLGKKLRDLELQRLERDGRAGMAAELRKLLDSMALAEQLRTDRTAA